MEKSSFFNAVLDSNGSPDRAYLAEDFAKYFSTFIGNGVFPNPSNNLQVTNVVNSMKIKINKGIAWINGYFYDNTDDLILKIEPADGVLDRIDRVVLRLDFLNREIKIYVKKGSFEVNPIPQSLQRDLEIYELAIADIRIKHGDTTTVGSQITDLRMNSSLCGWVTGTIKQVDTTTIFNQYKLWVEEKMQTNEFDEWFIALKNKLDPGEDVALQLQSQIWANAKKIENIDLSANKVKLNKISGMNATEVQTAIQELFINADNAQKGISNVIGSPLSASDTLTTQKDKIQALKNTFASNLTSKDISASGSESLNNLINKLSRIKSIKMANGKVLCPTQRESHSGESAYFVKVDGLSFEPDVVLLYADYYKAGGVTIAWNDNYIPNGMSKKPDLCYATLADRDKSATNKSSTTSWYNGWLPSDFITSTSFHLPVSFRGPRDCYEFYYYWYAFKF